MDGCDDEVVGVGGVLLHVRMEEAMCMYMI